MPWSFSGNYDLPGKGAMLGGWRTNWVVSMYSGQAQTINCTPATGAGTGCYALVVGDPYAGGHDVNQFYNPAAFANPAPVATIGQTDFSPLGGQAQPGDRPADAAARHGLREAVRNRGRAAVRDSVSRLQRHEHAGVQPAGLAGLPATREISRASRACAIPRARCRWARSSIGSRNVDLPGASG